MAESRDPHEDEPSPDIQVPELDLQEDNEALHTLASDPKLWRAFQEVVAALGKSGPASGWWIDFGVGSSMMTVTRGSDGMPSFSYDEAPVHESEAPSGRGLDPGGFAVIDLDDEDDE